MAGRRALIVLSALLVIGVPAGWIFFNTQQFLYP